MMCVQTGSAVVDGGAIYFKSRVSRVPLQQSWDGTAAELQHSWYEIGLSPALAQCCAVNNGCVVLYPSSAVLLSC